MKLFIALFTLLSTLGNCACFSGLQLFIGPEIYHVVRQKEGGAEQNGTLYGFRIGYDRIKRQAIYSGADFLYAQGYLYGKVNDNHLKSKLTDLNVEGRLGYTFQSKYGMQSSLTPFFGAGNFWETNKYQRPSPINIHFHNRFTYGVIGFLFHARVRSDLTAGLNFKARYLIEGSQRVSNDPEYGEMMQHYDHRIQYRIELPINYFVCYKNKEWIIGLVPFYEYRPYGHHANFPFDFLETKFRLFGATLKLITLY